MLIESSIRSSINGSPWLCKIHRTSVNYFILIGEACDHLLGILRVLLASWTLHCLSVGACNHLCCNNENDGSHNICCHPWLKILAFILSSKAFPTNSWHAPTYWCKPAIAVTGSSTLLFHSKNHFRLLFCSLFFLWGELSLISLNESFNRWTISLNDEETSC